MDVCGVVGCVHVCGVVWCVYVSGMVCYMHVCMGLKGGGGDI